MSVQPGELFSMAEVYTLPSVILFIIIVNVISVVLSGRSADISGRFTVWEGRREVDVDFRETPRQPGRVGIPVHRTHNNYYKE